MLPVIDLVETYVWNPDALSNSDRDRVHAALHDDPALSSWASFLADVQSNLPGAGPALPDHVQRFAESLYTPPRRIRLAAEVANQSAGALTLAAATTTSQSRFAPFGSVVNRREGILIRFLLDRESGTVRGYVLSDNKDVLRSAVFIPDATGEALCPDAYGMVQFVAHNPPSSLSVDEHTALLLPASRTRIDSECTEDTRILSDERGRRLLRVVIEPAYFQVEHLADDVFATHSVNLQPAELFADGARVPRSQTLPHEFRVYVR